MEEFSVCRHCYKRGTEHCSDCTREYRAKLKKAELRQKAEASKKKLEKNNKSHYRKRNDDDDFNYWFLFGRGN